MLQLIEDLNLNDTQIDKLFKGVVLAVATEAERKNQNAMGRGVLKLLRQAALKALRAQKSDPFDVQPGYSWLEENEVEYARASLALPITGGSILILALVSLNFFHRTFGPAKDDQAQAVDFSRQFGRMCSQNNRRSDCLETCHPAWIRPRQQHHP